MISSKNCNGGPGNEKLRWKMKPTRRGQVLTFERDGGRVEKVCGEKKKGLRTESRPHYRKNETIGGTRKKAELGGNERARKCFAINRTGKKGENRD